MPSLSLTMPSPSSSRSRPWALAVAALAVVAGLVLAMLWSALWPLGLSAAGALAGARLMQAQPLLPYMEYFSANEDGLSYRQAPGRVDRYKWTELRGVSAELRRQGAGAPQLLLHTGRGAMHGATVHLAMRSDADCLAAQQAAEHWLSAYRL